MKRTFSALLIFLLSLNFVFSMGKMDSEPQKKYTLRQPEGEPIAFNEIWGYVAQRYPKEYKPEYPLTDVCFFSGDFSCYGELTGAPKRSILQLPEGTRAHFTVICDSKSLTHFLINPEYAICHSAIKQIIEHTKDFDGLQLDFELVPNLDGNLFLEFLKQCRLQLDKAYGENAKMFSVCLPARTHKVNPDPYPYKEIAELCDRVFIMAYDEHWSTSAPGPIASFDWCQRVCQYVMENIPAEKLIIGMPFYGRTWGDSNPSRAYYYSTLEDKLINAGVNEITYENDIPTFKYTTQVQVTGYFNDCYSLVKMCSMYKNNGIKNVGFWRIGQEDTEFWKWLFVEKSPSIQ